MTMRTMLAATEQFPFRLVFLKYLNEPCVKDFLNTYQNTFFFNQKQFNSQLFDSTEHATTQLIDWINDNFENNCFTLNFIVDLSDVIESFNEKVLISKLCSEKKEAKFFSVFSQKFQILSNFQ